MLSSALSLLALLGAFSFGRSAPELRALFVPLHAPAWRYDVLVSDESIDAVATRLRAAMPPSREAAAAGAWAIERPEPLDAFGADGRYDRYRLVRLFGGARPEVARGPLMRDGQSVGSVTLISPYPNPALTELRRGTLIILTVVRKQPPGKW